MTLHSPTLPRCVPGTRFLRRTLRPVLALPLLLAMTSCLPLPLGDPQHSQVDARLAGLWTSKGDSGKGDSGKGEGGKEMGVLIVPFDAHAYMIQAAEYTNAGGKYQTESTMMLKAWLADVKGSRFIVCQPAVFMTPGEHGDHTLYATYRLTLEGDVLKAKMVNEDYAKFKEIRDSAALAKVIEENLDDPQMYRNDPLELHRVNTRDGTSKELGRLFGI